jgi:hypothetical protein
MPGTGCAASDPMHLSKYIPGRVVGFVRCAELEWFERTHRTCLRFDRDQAGTAS